MALNENTKPAQELKKSVPFAKTPVQAVQQPVVVETPEPDAAEPVAAPAVVPAVVQAAEVVAPPVVLTVTKMPTVSAPEVSTLDAMFARAKEVAETPVQLAMVIRFKQSVDRYVTTLGPGKMVEPKAGAYEQYLLCEALRDFFNNESEQIHRLLWNYFLISMYQTYGDRTEYMTRFLANEWTYGKARHDFLLTIVNLVLWTANPAKRAVGIKKIAAEYRFQGDSWTEKARSNMVRFYGL